MPNYAERELTATASPLSKYVFHFLPGIPILVAMCILDYYGKWGVLAFIIDAVKGASNSGLFGLSFFLLIVTLCLIFLFGMIADAVRHAIEELCLAEWTECRIIKRISKQIDTKEATIEYNWGVIQRFRESEYYYIEFYGGIAISFAFLWGVITFRHFHEHFLLYVFWAHIVLVVRALADPLLQSWQNKMLERKETTFQRILNIFPRIFDFLSTISSMILLSIFHHKFADETFHFFFAGITLIAPPFEFYIIRYRRYRRILKEVF